MQISDIPTYKFQKPFADGAGGGYINTIPSASQIGITDGAASLTDGFPPITFIPISSGGVPPLGQDFNGVLKGISAWTKWQNAGGLVTYDSAFSTAIGGYPIGALLAGLTSGTIWLSLVDNNTVNPDSGQSVNWAALPTTSRVQSNAYNFANASGTANSIVITLSPSPVNLAALLGAPVIIKTTTSANTGPVTININGLGSVSIVAVGGGALGSGAIPANAIIEIVYDGTNFLLIGGSPAASSSLTLAAGPLYGLGTLASPLGILQATTAALGVVQLATNAECIAATDTQKSVTPAGLGAKLNSLPGFNPVPASWDAVGSVIWGQGFVNGLSYSQITPGTVLACGVGGTYIRMGDSPQVNMTYGNWRAGGVQSQIGGLGVYTGCVFTRIS